MHFLYSPSCIPFSPARSLFVSLHGPTDQHMAMVETLSMSFIFDSEEPCEFRHNAWFCCRADFTSCFLKTTSAAQEPLTFSMDPRALKDMSANLFFQCPEIDISEFVHALFACHPMRSTGSCHLPLDNDARTLSVISLKLLSQWESMNKSPQKTRKVKRYPYSMSSQ